MVTLVLTEEWSKCSHAATDFQLSKLKYFVNAQLAEGMCSTHSQLGLFQKSYRHLFKLHLKISSEHVSESEGIR